MEILVVDDEKALRDIVYRSLSGLGHTVHAAGGVDDAERILGSALSIDLVITDICMPGRNGIELLQWVKQQKPEIEVILMTGFSAAEGITAAVDQHAFAYLRKPFHMTELAKVIERAGMQISLAKNLKASELRYRTLVEGIAAAVLSIDRNMIITSASERCAAVLGYTPEQLTGQSLDILRPEEQRATLSEKIANLLAQAEGAMRMDAQAVRSDGAVIHTQEIATPFVGAAGGLPDVFFCVIEDVTTQRNLEESIGIASDYLDAIRRSRSPSRMIVGESEPIKEVLQLIRSVAPSSASIMICGESGTGKELVAESIHINSSRAAKPFVVINCATLQESLLESELFGHKKGSFTGAMQDKRGLVEIANGGTLFVDEVAEMAPSVQAKVLRVLEQGQFRRVGCTEDRTTDVRVVAATNRDLAAEVEAGRFREDLFYRLNVIRIDLPPLRNRREDIPIIAEHLLRHSTVTPQRPKRLTAEALTALIAYNWPGNVRELSNVIERAVILSGDKTTIGAEFLSVSPAKSAPIKRLEHMQQEELEKALAQAGGNKTLAARMLGITRQTITSRLKRRGAAAERQMHL